MVASRLALSPFMLGVILASLGGCRKQEGSEAAFAPAPLPTVRDREPILQLDLKQVGDGYELRWGECSPPQRSYELHTASVTYYEPEQRPSKDDVVCRLTIAPSGGPSLRAMWRYGIASPGYTLHDCRPLDPGRQYTVAVQAGARGVEHFRIRTDGSVLHLGGGLCGNIAR